MPEVASCTRMLERGGRAGQAGAMPALLRRLFEPMNLAAYVAWGAIDAEAWSAGLEGTGLPRCSCSRVR